MQDRCPLCGASTPTGGACRDRFDAERLRALEDPACYAVHHLSVPCYMLQHNEYTREGWLAVRQPLRDFLGGPTPEEAQRRIRAAGGRAARGWSHTRGPKLPGVEAIPRSRTIADVRTDSAANYRADVRAWAASSNADSEALVRASI